MMIEEMCWKMGRLATGDDGTVVEEKLGRENSKKKAENWGGKRVEREILES